MYTIKITISMHSPIRPKKALKWKNKNSQYEYHLSLSKESYRNLVSYLEDIHVTFTCPLHVYPFSIQCYIRVCHSHMCLISTLLFLVLQYQYLERESSMFYILSNAV
jgi:hypothetical protein